MKIAYRETQEGGYLNGVFVKHYVPSSGMIKKMADEICKAEDARFIVEIEELVLMAALDDQNEKLIRSVLKRWSRQWGR